MAAPAAIDFGPLGVNGETPSRLDQRKTLSYDRWSMSVVYSGGPGQCLRAEDVQGSVLTLAAHARIIIEQVTRRDGYKVFDCDMRTMEPVLGGRHYGEYRFDAHVRVYNDIDYTLANIHGSTGVLIKTSEKIEEVIRYIHDKERESSHYSQSRLLGRNPVPSFLFDLRRPDPANNIFNCITFTFEAARAGGINLYALYDGGRLIPSRDIVPIKQAIDKAIDCEYPLDEELRDYIQAYDDGSKARIRDIETKMVSMVVLGGNGPLVLSHYKRLAREQELAPNELHGRALMQAIREVRRNPLEQSANDVGMVVISPFVLLGTPIATAIEHIFSSVLSKKREKKAAIEFFEKE